MATLSSSQGFLEGNVALDEFNRHSFVINQMLNKVQTSTLVKVVAVTNNGGVSPVGYVDVVPMVAQIDNAGNPTEHVTIHNLPYFRLQGGSNAIILDPQIGDIGIAVFASRDITQVKKTKKASSPTTRRKFSYADGLYIGGVLNGTPNQYVQFNASGITITSTTAVTLNAPTVTINAPLITLNASTKVRVTSPIFEVTGTIKDLCDSTGSTMSAMRTAYNSHTHSDPQGGSVGAPSNSM